MALTLVFQQARPCALAAPAAPQTRPGRPAALPAARQLRRGGAAGVGRLAAASPSGAGGVAQTCASDEPARDFASSLALIVLGAALISERLNGEGLVAVMELDHPHIEPLLWGVAGALALAAAWPSKPRPAGSSGSGWLRRAAGRLAFAGLAAALATELYTGSGLLALLEIETGAEALTEAETLLAVLSLFILTGPSSKAASRR